MIKRLILVRHGKSVSENGLIPDIDRTLKERGIKDAYLMAEKLKKKDNYPDLIISSSATRAMHTATIFARVFEIDVSKTILNDSLYLADPHTILDIICKTNDNINSLLMVGHNPGFTDIANFFLPKEIGNLPTTGIVELKFDINYWPDILNIRPIESFVDNPKNII